MVAPFNPRIPQYFQYPDLGSWDCNDERLRAGKLEIGTFSILTSDRGTATERVFEVEGQAADLSVS